MYFITTKFTQRLNIMKNMVLTGIFCTFICTNLTAQIVHKRGEHPNPDIVAKFQNTLGIGDQPLPYFDVSKPSYGPWEKTWRAVV